MENEKSKTQKGFEVASVVEVSWLGRGHVPRSFDPYEV